VDNFNSHHDDGNGNMHTALESSNVTLRYLVVAATDKIQPCDSFVISKIKDAWMEIWDDYKFKAIKDGLWRVKDLACCKIPENHFFCVWLPK
jgi:hypothetical protein